MKKMIKDGISFVLVLVMIMAMGLITLDGIDEQKTPEFSIEVESEYNPEYREYETDESEYVVDEYRDYEDEEYDRLNDESSYSYSYSF